MDRRVTRRARLGDGSLWLNKYVGGYPCLAEVVEVSDGGLLIRTIREPSNRETGFTLEFEIPGSSHRMWLWAELVRVIHVPFGPSAAPSARTSGVTLQAVRISHADLLERAQLRQLVRWREAA